MDIILSPAEAEQFQTALLSAFPQRGDLEQLVYFRLGQDLDQIVPAGTYAHNATSLVKWANAEGKAWELLRAARDKVPGNPKLRAFDEQIQARQAPAPPPIAAPSIPIALTKELIDILLALPTAQDFGGRSNLLLDLPAVTGLSRNAANARDDLEGVVAQLRARGQLASGEWPLLIVIDNALPFVQGYALGNQLSDLRQRLAQIYAGV